MMSSRPTNAPPQMNRTLARVEWDARLGRVLPAALWRHRGDRAFEHLQEGVLDALPHVLEARPASLDLVNLVDVDDALLGGTEVAFGCLDQPGQQALHVIADVPGFRQARGITDGERDVQVARKDCEQGGSSRCRKDRSGGCWTSPPPLPGGRQEHHGPSNRRDACNDSTRPGQAASCGRLNQSRLRTGRCVSCSKNHSRQGIGRAWRHQS